MRVDHIAYRVKDRNKTAQFFIDFFGYKKPEDLQDGFDIQFEDGSWAKCLVLEPPEKIDPQATWSLFEISGVEYHIPPEIFISDGSSGSIVRDWVNKHNGVGGIHHIAYQVPSVQKIVDEWREKGFCDFASKEPLKCDGLVQIFTKPSELSGIIYEFIEREKQGFCAKNVKNLMNSTKDNKF